MAPSGTSDIINVKEGLNIKSIPHLYKDTHAMQSCQIQAEGRYTSECSP